MSDIAAVRRFMCRACGRVHLSWSARCSGCLSLEGLVAANDTVLPSVQPTPSPAQTASEELPHELSRPRLVIARAPSPEPSLEDPATELSDVVEEEMVPLSDVAETTFVRDSTGLPPLDHVLGGGLVVASVVLLASPPGIGKTSLTLQMLNGLGHRCLYVTGEETCPQVAATARRIGAASKKIYPLAERSLDKIFAKARSIRAQTIAVDSIQKMICEDIGGRAGSPAQLKECTARLVDYAKTTETAVWIIGHVTGDGDVAGPKTLEHDVDVVLELSAGAAEGDDSWAKLKRLSSEQPDLSIAEALRIVEEVSAGAGLGNERILRCPLKNRFGATNVLGRFELTNKGFVPVDADGWNEEL
jgi:predicted ATP-dependent serine protease